MYPIHTLITLYFKLQEQNTPIKSYWQEDISIPGTLDHKPEQMTTEEVSFQFSRHLDYSRKKDTDLKEHSDSLPGVEKSQEVK